MMKRVKKIKIIFATFITVYITLIIIGICFFCINFHQLIPLLPIAPDVLGMHGTKTYLVLFQNNEELRPGGGFIGSYGIVSIDKGKISPLIIHNVYDADGQLHKHVEPYFIGRRYLQVHLYMRDSNFDVDFVKSAQKVALMLQLETGQKVDGVVSIDLSFVRSLIEVIAPINMWQYNETINGNNFFLTTEKYSDKNSFAGSTQKQDFLHALFIAMQVKIETNKLLYYFQFAKKAMTAVQEKHVLFMVNNKYDQDVLTKNHFSSSLQNIPKTKTGQINDVLGINEANIGINKANYFVRRNIMQNVSINQTGVIKNTVNITYTNTTKKQAWPSGIYKTYIRIMLPLHTKLDSISINGSKQNVIPAVTNFRVYEAPNFTPPQGLEVDTATEEGLIIYGFIVSVGLQETKTVTINYTLSKQYNLKNINNYKLYLFKQPGAKNDPYSITVSYSDNNKQKILENETFPFANDKMINLVVPSE